MDKRAVVRVLRNLIVLLLISTVALFFSSDWAPQLRHLNDARSAQNVVKSTSLPSKSFPVLRHQGAHLNYLSKRDVWSDNVGRGCQLLTLMREPTLDAKYNPKYTSYDDLAKYGWTRKPPGSMFSELETAELTSMAPALEALDLGKLDDTAAYTLFDWENEDRVLQPGTTDQYFEEATHSLDQTKYALIPVTAFLTWAHEAGDSAKNLKYFGRNYVHTDETLDLVRHILGNQDLSQVLTAWPGKQVLADTPEGRAMMGSPHGRAIAWMLAQHKDTFGTSRSIKSLNIWNANNGPSTRSSLPNLLFTLEDYEAPASPAPGNGDPGPAHASPDTDNGDPSPAPASHVNRLSKRDDYADSIGRGCRLLALMQSETKSPEWIPKYTDYANLASLGWTKNPTGDIDLNINDDERTSSGTALAALNLGNLDDKAYTAIKWVDNLDARADGKTYKASQAYYKGIYSKDHGIILVTSTEGPDKVENPPPVESRTPLKQWSDITFLTWADFAGNAAKNLIYIMHVNVITEETCDVLRKILGNEDLSEVLKPYSAATVIQANTDEGKALIGSPHGRGPAWLLIEHNDTLGLTRSIKSITVWDSADGENADSKMCSTTFQTSSTP